MMGIRPASSLDMNRIARAASKPDIWGIRRSISTMSYQSGGDCMNFSTQTWPSWAQSTSMPSSWSSSLAIS